MTFNTLVGGGDGERFARLEQVVVDAAPDVLVLQECVGWEDMQRAHHLAQRLGIPTSGQHVFVGQARPRGSGKRYSLAAISRLPLQNVHMYNDAEHLAHGILQFDVQPGLQLLHLFVTHLDAHDESLRVRDVGFLHALVPPARFAEEFYCLLGDLNSMSRRDPYAADLPSLLEAAGTTKYGLPPRYDVTDALEAFGWIDALYQRGTPAAWITASRHRGGVHIDYRTDYVYVSPALAPHLEAISIVAAHQASDHEGVVAELDLGAKQNQPTRVIGTSELGGAP